jgi:hypothetical protein
MALARLPIALLAVAVLAGCGSTPTTRVTGETLHLRIDEFRILPKKLSVRTGRIRILGRNVGILTHNVKVFSTVFKDPQGNFVIVGGTDTVHPGETATGTVELKPGTYRLADTIANHDDLGAYATLIVTP